MDLVVQKTGHGLLLEQHLYKLNMYPDQMKKITENYSDVMDNLYEVKDKCRVDYTLVLPYFMVLCLVDRYPYMMLEMYKETPHGGKITVGGSMISLDDVADVIEMFESYL